MAVKAGFKNVTQLLHTIAVSSSYTRAYRDVNSTPGKMHDYFVQMESILKQTGRAHLYVDASVS